MLYLNAITGVQGQNVTEGQNFHPGQWIREGYGDRVVRKGVYLGRIKSTGEDIILWDLGQPRPEFMHQMKVMRQFVKESNLPGRKMKDLFGYLARIFG